MFRAVTLAIALVPLTATVAVAQVRAEAAFRNPDLSPEQRAADLVSRMTLEMEMEPSDVVAAVGRDTYSIRWTATLTPVTSGDYQLIVRTNRWNRTGKARLFLDDRELEFGGGPGAQMTSTAAAPSSRRPVLATARLEPVILTACGSSSGRPVRVG